MTPIDDYKLVLYAAGELPPTEVEAIEQRLRSDPELAAELECIRLLSGLGTKPDVPPSRWSTAYSTWVNRAGWFWRRHPQWSVGLMIALCSGISVAGWSLRPIPALLSDDFQDNWVDTSKWYLPRNAGTIRGIRERGGTMKLVNRGTLVSFAQFDPPYELSFDWSWSDLGINPLYADHLIVALRSSGEIAENYPYEAKDGVIIRFNPTVGAVEAYSLPLPEGINHSYELETFAKTREGAILMLAEQWHRIRILDFGDRIEVFVITADQSQAGPPVPILRASCPTIRKGGHIVIYNRELVGNVPHESFIDNFVLRRIP